MNRIGATALVVSAMTAWAATPSAATLGGCANREVRVSDATVVEGDLGDDRRLRFLVTGNGCKLGSVAYSTAAATGVRAWPGVDYVSTSGTLTWSMADLVDVRVIEVPVVGDDVAEDDEVFWLELSGPSGVTISDPIGVGTIVDDDALIAISEPDCPQLVDRICELPVVSSRAKPRETTVHFATVDVTAVSGTDYVGVPLGSITIPAGATVARIKITTRSAGGGKQFDVRIFDPSSGTISVDRQRVTIPLS